MIKYNPDGTIANPEVFHMTGEHKRDALATLFICAAFVIVLCFGIWLFKVSNDNHVKNLIQKTLETEQKRLEVETCMNGLTEELLKLECHTRSSFAPSRY